MAKAAQITAEFRELNLLLQDTIVLVRVE